jgi:hypothetical protein
MISGGTDITLQKAIQKQMVECEMNTIKEVLRRLLDREPTIEDAQRCSQILSDPWNDTYILTYNKVKIGIVRYVRNEEKFRVEFQPFKTAN